MHASDELSTRRFYRLKDQAVLGGVCSGIAEYFGFNLRMTRLLTVIGLVFAGPMVLLIYIGIVLLVPYKQAPSESKPFDPLFRSALRRDPERSLNDVRRRFQTLNERLVRLERHVTSKRYNLDKEFSKL